MTSEEAIQKLEELRGIADKGESLAPYKGRIDELYWNVCGKHLRKCNCKNVLKDALLEIYAKLMYHKKTNTTMAQSKLVAGVVLQWKSNHYTNANLTDDVAREFLAAFPMRKDWFEVLPSATTDKEVVAEVAETPEKGAEIAPKEEEPKKQPTTPKKKKTAKKRK